MQDINLACYVFTTKYVVKESSLVTTVLHEADGDWQFLGHEQNLCIEDAMLLSLKEILIIDSSLRSILNLPLGKKAIRKDIKDNWKILDILD